MRKFIGTLTFLVLAASVIALQFNHAAAHPAKAATLAAPDTQDSCTASSFSLRKTKAVRAYDMATLTGIVTNHCTVAVGIQLKWTAFNSDGTVAFSQDFWPASTTNIPPGTDYAFEMMDTAPRGKWTYEVSAISITRW